MCVCVRKLDINWWLSKCVCVCVCFASYLTNNCSQSGYKECVGQLLVKYPDEVDRLIWLVKQESIPRDKVKETDSKNQPMEGGGSQCCVLCSPRSQVESVLEYLCKSGFSLMVNIISRLAHLTATAGMELLRYMCVGNVPSHGHVPCHGNVPCCNTVCLFL